MARDSTPASSFLSSLPKKSSFYTPSQHKKLAAYPKTPQQPCLNLLQTSIPLHLHLLQNVVINYKPNMVMASLDVYQTIFFSNTTTTPSRLNLLPDKPPTFSFQNSPSISIFSRRLWILFYMFLIYIIDFHNKSTPFGSVHTNCTSCQSKLWFTRKQALSCNAGRETHKMLKCSQTLEFTMHQVMC